MNPERLNLPLYRRVAGAVLVFAFFAIGACSLLMRGGGNVADAAFLPSATDGWCMLAMGVIYAPFILWPCLFRRFPYWMYRTCSPRMLAQLRWLLTGCSERSQK